LELSKPARTPSGLFIAMIKSLSKEVLFSSNQP
jgi:hypothetical protein